MNQTDIIGVASGHGARDARCAKGPDALIQFGLIPLLRQRGAAVDWIDTLRPLRNPANALKQVEHIARRLEQEVRRVVGAKRFPVVIGGDHSYAVGTWAGVHNAVGKEVSVGLIWIDAHMDSHTPETTPSGALHGMPLACLLGHGDATLTALGGISPTLLPQHVCVMGVRDYELEEAALLQRLGVRVMFMEELNRRGLHDAWREALAIAGTGTAGYGISIDLDAIDPQDAPGVGTPAQGGIRGAGLAQALCSARDDNALLALEIMEFNPAHDVAQKTAHLIVDLLSSFTVDNYCNEPDHSP